MNQIEIPQVVFCLEELSAKAFLQAYLPRRFPTIYEHGFDPKFLVFEGKSDLEKRLERRLKGWLIPETKFVVLRDQDSGDCHAIKTELLQKCVSASRPNTLIRIACQELESWYLGHLAAVDAAFGTNRLAKQQQVAKYRSPDNLGNAKEELKRLTKQTYQQVGGSREIGKHMDVDESTNRSKSFQVFVSGVERILAPTIDGIAAAENLEESGGEA